jgi:hypothetical protein
MLVGGLPLWTPASFPIPEPSARNIFALTGNGTNNGTTDFADSFIKLSTGLTVLDWFRPPNWPFLEQYDLDPSSSGPI